MGGGNLTASRNISKFAFTMAGGGQAAPIFGCMARRIAFTMAEILLSLTIIGVVAAITLPSLMGNINERTWNTQRKALHARMSQAIAMMPQLSGYGNYQGDYISLTSDTVAEAFLTEGLSKVIKINNICDADNLADCGIQSTYIDLSGSSRTLPTQTSAMFNSNGSELNFKPASFETQNGESVVVFYNPNCKVDQNWDGDLMINYICAYFVYDLNGSKGPNALGKDMGTIAALYSMDPMVVAPMPLSAPAGEAGQYSDASTMCTAQDPDSRLMNKHEMLAFLSTIYFWGLDDTSSDNKFFWTGSKVGPYVHFGYRKSYDKDGSAQTDIIDAGVFAEKTGVETATVQCIKR